ncbi:uncharacterized protein CLUP02_03112 [Colletotrichum lupini]|uniref:Uncharacterized protein n=1 Tax=Colletotrichum lupini TaxID=145971 RepID=A0A9Q8SIB5_9PEZI|nr:uncharacterized protein CLUP02_03112 [Colletotrichum lupini]UQC77643.1 hypothetical protein CLUP02_03112 [Colletotrichum lupini]
MRCLGRRTIWNLQIQPSGTDQLRPLTIESLAAYEMSLSPRSLIDDDESEGLTESVRAPYPKHRHFAAHERLTNMNCTFPNERTFSTELAPRLRDETIEFGCALGFGVFGTSTHKASMGPDSCSRSYPGCPTSRLSGNGHQKVALLANVHRIK